MSQERTQPVTEFTISNFETSGWQAAFEENTCALGISDNLWNMAKQAEDNGAVDRGKLLRLLGNVCSLALQPMNVSDPFVSSVRLRNRRSAKGNDFDDASLDFFQKIIPLIDNPWLKARLADLLWTRRRIVDMALIAIEAYMTTPITEDSFSREGGSFWLRALRLSGLFKDKTAKKRQEIGEALLNGFFSVTVEQGFLGRWLADILYRFDLGADRKNEIVEKLELLAAEFRNREDYHLARGYYEAVFSWLQSADKETDSWKAFALLSTTWEQEAFSQESHGNYIGASHCMEKALQSYRCVPQKYRGDLGVQQKLTKLHERRAANRPRISESLVPVSVPCPSEVIEKLEEMNQKARKGLEGKGFIAALGAFLGLYRGVNLDEIEKRAQTEVNTFCFRMFGSTEIVDSEGRVQERRPAVVSAIDDEKAREDALQDEMLRQYLFEIQCVADGYIIPALEVFAVEHCLTRELFTNFCRQSTIVPPKRINAWGRMLFSGFEFDFDDVIHRLVPQVEEMVRYHFQAARVITSTTDEQGVEHEANLGTLLEKPEAISVFGKERVFEMLALFHKKSGPVFRHRLAHGLLEDENFASAYAIYAWWFALKLVLSPFSNPLVKE